MTRTVVALAVITVLVGSSVTPWLLTLVAVWLACVALAARCAAEIAEWTR